MPGLAPQLAAFKRRLFNLPAPTRGSGEASNGEPVQVEILVNGVWVDITDYVMVRDDQGKISITYGIRDEGSQTEQSTSTLPLKNQDGRFTRRNPTGPYYGYIGRNTPCRISVPDGMGGKSYRQQGEISKWPKSWDPTGTDVWVDVNAAGLLQRLSQAPPPERSVIYNAVTNPQPTGLVAYWPMEDVTGATSLASALTSGSPMTWSGTPALASYEGFTASDPLPDLTSGALSGGVARYDDPTSTQVRFLAHIPTVGLSDGKVLCAVDQLDYSAGSAQFFELYYSTTTASNSLVLRTCASDGTVLGAELPHTLDVRGHLLYVSIELQESGTSITRQVQLKDVTSGHTYSVNDTEALTALSRVTRVQFGPASRAVSGPAGSANLPGVAVGHATVENQITAIDALGVRLNPIGEKAGRRIQRLCAENAIAFEWVGDLDDTVAMGAQTKQNPLSLIQECVLADDGLLYETRDVLGLGYRTRPSLYNQDPALTLNYTAYNLSDIPTPVEDDRYLANRVVVSVNGVTATYEQTDGPLSTEQPPAGVGVYGANSESPLTLNLADSETPTLLDQAAWRVHRGTVDEDRFPQISVNLAHPSITPDMRRAILALRLGDRVQITNPPLWVGPDTIDQLILGIDPETITHFEHRLTFTCQPSSPYNTIAVLDDGITHLDTDSVLLAAVTSSDTKLSVVAPVQDGPLWSTDDADAPWDIRFGGEVATVTANTSAVFDNFSRTVSNGWGTANSGQSWTVVGTAADYAVGSGVGSVTLPATGIAHLTLATAPTADVDLYVSVATSALATGASLLAGPIIRAADNNNHYMARIEFTTAAGLILTLRKRVAGTETVLATYTPADITHVAGTFYRVRLQAYGAVIRARVWDLSITPVEPTDWQVSAVDTSISTADNLGTRCFSNAGNTNVNPVISYDSFDLHNVQTLTATRSINGVVKAHSAGEDVVLAHTPVLSP